MQSQMYNGTFVLSFIFLVLLIVVSCWAWLIQPALASKKKEKLLVKLRIEKLLVKLRNRVRYTLAGSSRIVELSDLEKDVIVQFLCTEIMNMKSPKPHFSEDLSTSQIILRNTVERLIQDEEIEGRFDGERYIPDD